MKMKDTCKKFLELLKDDITDSFYDDDGGDYVELYIENPDNEDLNLQIEIDSEYFGLSYRSYDETYSYDEHSEENIILLADKIHKIISGELCMITLYRENKGWSVDILEETSKVNDSCLEKFVADVTDDGDNGYIEVVIWGESDYDSYDFDDKKLVKQFFMQSRYEIIGFAFCNKSA